MKTAGFGLRFFFVYINDKKLPQHSNFTVGDQELHTANFQPFFSVSRPILVSRAVDTALIGWFHTHHDFISVYELNLWQVLTTEPVTPEASFGTFDTANTIKRDSGVIARNLQASAGGFFEFLAPASHVEASRITGQQFCP